MGEEAKTRAKLSPGQCRVMDVLRRRERRIAWVSIREIVAELGLVSPNGVAIHLHALEKKGYIKRAKNQARGIEIIHEETSSEAQHGP